MDLNLNLNEIEKKIKKAAENKDIEGLAFLFHNKALFYQNHQKFNEALNSFKQSMIYALESKNHHLIALNFINQGHCYESLSQFEKAKATYQFALSAAKSLKDGKMIKQILQKLFQLTKHQKIALESPPIPVEKLFDKDGAMSLLHEASSHFSKKDYGKAIEFLNKVTEINPNFHVAWLFLIESHLKLENPEEVIRCGEQALKIKPEMGFYWGYIGEGYEMKGDKKKARNYYKNAIKAFEKSISRHPKEDIYFNGISWFLMKMKRYKESIPFSEEALKLNPESEHHFHSIGLANYKMGNYQDALKYLRLSLEKNPVHDYAWYDLGRVYEKLDNTDEAIKCFENAVNFNPQWKRTKRKLRKLNPDSPFLSLNLPRIPKELDKNKKLRKERERKRLEPRTYKDPIIGLKESSEHLLELDEKLEFLKTEGMDNFVRKTKKFADDLLKLIEEKDNSD